MHPQTTNVIYVHGSIDPWHALGLVNSSDASMPTIYIEGTAHCANMYEPQDNDFPQLKEAREKIKEFLGALFIWSDLTDLFAINSVPNRSVSLDLCVS